MSASLAEKLNSENPTWEGGRFTDGTPPTPADKVTTPLTLRRLSNGIRVGVTASDAESQRGHLRVVAPGGRVAEQRLGFKQGSMAVGARAMQEGGAFGEWTREQVELFCVDHLIMVEITCNEEFFTMDFVFPTTEVGNVGFGDNIKMGITGTEAVLQIVREIIAGFEWEEDALGRSKQNFHGNHDSLFKSLEGMSSEKIMMAMTGDDARFGSLNHEDIDAVTLEEAKTAVMSQLLPSELEISVVGDFDVPVALDLIRKYIGTIPKDTNVQYLERAPKFKEALLSSENDDNPAAMASPPSFVVPQLAYPGKHLDLTLEDPDPRAVAYVSGAAPNMWGYNQDGRNVAELVMELAGNKATKFDSQRRRHPLFPQCALSMISEIVNRRLFSNVREKKQLTYDANFKFTGFEQIGGGYFLCTVTASREKAEDAMEACKETLEALISTQPITADNLESAKRVVVNRHEGELRTTKYLAELMSGIQLSCVPKKGPLSLTDFNAMCNAITLDDLKLVLKSMDIRRDGFYTAIGRTVRPEGAVEVGEGEDEVVVVRGPPGSSRGGPLMG